MLRYFPSPILQFKTMSYWFNIGNFVSLLFLIGATIMSFFLILSGARNTGVLKNFYWIEANTTGFNDASNLTRWFNYEFCGYSNGQLFNCSSKAPAKPFSPRDNFGFNTLMPTSFLDDRDAYYYLSRVGWAMLLIAIFCEVMTLIPQIVSVFKHIRSLSVFATVFHWLSLFFILLTACLLTGCYAKGIRAFHSQNRHAKMGVKCFALLWTTVFLLLCTSIWMAIATALKKREKRRKSSSYYTTTVVPSSTDMDDYGYSNAPVPVTNNSVELVDRNDRIRDSSNQPSQLPRNPNTVVPSNTVNTTNLVANNTVSNQTSTKHKLFNKIKSRKHNDNSNIDNINNMPVLPTTKEEDEENDV